MSKELLKKGIGTLLILLFFIPLISSFLNPIKAEIYYFDRAKNVSIAGDISDINLSTIPEINYTVLNASWYDQKVEMLIITPDNQDFVDAATPLMQWKNEKGVKTEIRNSSSYAGTGAEQVKNLILDYYENQSLKWVLLAGDVPLIPIYEIDNPGTPSPISEPSDFYYADLTSDWSNIENLDWTAEVYVGRLPANDGPELENMINKTLKYETDPKIGDWMNRMLLSSGISDLEGDDGDSDGEDESRLTSYIIQNYIQSEMEFTHLCDYNGKSSYPPEGGYVPPQPFEDLTSSNTDYNFNLGYSTAIFAGHGSATSFSSKGIGNFYTWNQANSANNIDMPTLIYGDACEVAPYHELGIGTDDNIGEELIVKANTGAIGFIGSLDLTYYYTNDGEFEALNRGNAKLFWKEFFENNKHQPGKALYDSKLAYVNSEFYQYEVLDPEYPNLFADRRNLLTYNLLGDPEVDIYTNIPLSVPNPFTGKVYEGQFFSISLNPYAKIHMRNDLGAYRTVYADEDGVAKFRLPLGENLNYNVTITGHNYIPSYFNFTTLADQDVPSPIIDCSPEIPTTYKNIKFEICTNESGSGIECIYFFISVDSYDSYETHFISNNYLENKSTMEIILDRLDPGQYNYSIYIFARDYANNTQTYATSIMIHISAPLMDYILSITLIMMIIVAGISIVAVYSGNKKYSLISKRME